MKVFQLTIPNPCHENWEQMLPEEKGKFCMSCQKTVIDFSIMSDQEIASYFANYKGNTCGRFNEDQLNKKMSASSKRSMGRWKYFWQILMPMVFALHKADAQPKPKIGKVAVTKSCAAKDSTMVQPMGDVAVESQEEMVKGKITDERGAGIKNATVTIKNTKRAVISDADGIFSFDKVAVSSVLIITASGFEGKEIIISSKTNFSNMKIVLSKQQMRAGMIMIRKK